MIKRSWWLGGLVAVCGVLALTNPDEADYREQVRRNEGLGGSLGLAALDLLSSGKGGGIRRDNYLIASRFYLGGDGVLPRRTLGWGAAGMIWQGR